MNTEITESIVKEVGLAVIVSKTKYMAYPEISQDHRKIRIRNGSVEI